VSRELELVELVREAWINQDGTGIAHLNELESLLKKRILWPPKTRAEAERVFGGAIHNPKGRTHQALDRRIRHALKVWSDRYSMNPEQSEYADESLAWAIRQAEGRPVPIASAHLHLEAIVQDDRIHAGFKRRDGGVDVRHLIAEAAS
jgi:hypothetical protein